MPPKGSKVQNLKKTYLGTFQHNNKILEDMEKKIKDQKELILQKQEVVKKELDRIKQLDIELKEISSKINNKKRKLDHKRVLLEQTQRKTANLQDNVDKNKVRHEVKISATVVKRRKMNPTSKGLPNKAKIIRRKETFNACMAIHGGSTQDKEPIIEGMIDALTSQCTTKILNKKVLSSKPSFVKSIKEVVIKQFSKEYYASEENLLRSLNVYYSHNVLGKRKYLSIRKASRNATYHGSRISNYVPYSVLSKRINDVDIGNLQDISSLGEGEEDAKGVYRNPAEYILRLAKFYFSVNENRADKLKLFENIPRKNSDSMLFLLAVGGDSAPICGMSMLVSFLNVGKRIASSDEQFLVFGADVSESSKIVSNFVLKLISDIKYLESNVFPIQCNGVEYRAEFKLSELPNDMKMIAFLAGELSNSAFYFSTFGNVNQHNANDYQKSYGKDFSNDWKPFPIKKRFSDAEKVAEKKREFAKLNISKATKRSKLTSFMSTNLKSRQEYQPLVDTYIECAKAEPLHLKNNTIKERFMQLFKLCLSQSNLQNIKSYREVPMESFFGKFVEFIHRNMNCNFLSKKIKTWFNESSGKTEKEFSFRFRGKESFLYMQHFPSLIQMMLSNVTNDKIRSRLHEIFFESLRLRQLLSYSVRIEEFDAIMLTDMKAEARALFCACCLFEQRVSPSLWTLCNVAPYHAEQCLDQYQFGLGCNTMEGREQKHQQISKYIKNTTFQNRWPVVFRHEFLQLIYLRERGYDKKNYIKKLVKYVPDVQKNCCLKCGLEHISGKCKICDSNFMKKIESSIKTIQ